MTDKHGASSHERAASTLSGSEPTSTPRISRRLLKQHTGALICATLSSLFLVLTVAYASGSIRISQYRSIGYSRTYTILLLRVLSELTTITLGLTVALTIERLQWHNIIRQKGQPYLSYLGLSPGTGFLGLAKLSFGRGSITTPWRWWSMYRLFLLAILPVLNVIIFGESDIYPQPQMSAILTRRKANVRTHLSYHIEMTRSGPFSLGMGNFNASSARSLGVAQMTNSLIGLEFSDFLSDSRVAVDITPTHEDSIPCTLGYDKDTRQTCNQVLYMPGTYGDLDLLRNASLPRADMVIVHNMRGYQLDFKTSGFNTGVVYDLEQDCDIYGYDLVAFQICFKDHEDTIAMRLNTCLNWADLTQSACLSNTTWQQLAGISSNLGINVRNGSVGFSRLNSTIQTSNLEDDVKSANIMGAHLLDAFQGLFTGRSRGTTGEDVPSEMGDLFSSILGGLASLPQKIDMAPVIVATHFASGPMLYGSHHTGAARNTMSLHLLVAKVLYWSSMPIAGTLSTALEGGPRSRNLTDAIRFVDDGGQATYSLATSVHELVVGRKSIIAHGVLGGLVLLSCLVPLIFSLGSPRGRADTPTLSSYPDLDAHEHLDFVNIRDTRTDGRAVTRDQKLTSGFVTLRSEHGVFDASR